MPLPLPLARVMEVHANSAAIEAARAAAKDQTGFVYFILRANSQRVVKIGWAKDPELRRKKLQTGSPELLIVVATQPGTVLDEKALHKRFEALRCAPGSEWFKLRPPLAEYVDGLMRRARVVKQREAMAAANRRARRSKRR